MLKLAKVIMILSCVNNAWVILFNSFLILIKRELNEINSLICMMLSSLGGNPTTKQVSFKKVKKVKPTIMGAAAAGGWVLHPGCQQQ